MDGQTTKVPVTPEAAARAVARFRLMAYFPPEDDCRSEMIEIVLEMVDTQDQLDWLVAETSRRARWPGIGALRSLYCSRYKPKDGIESYEE
jgi:hypothetical protein